MKDTSPEKLAHTAEMECNHPDSRFGFICEKCVAVLIRRERAACAKLARSQNLWGGDVIADAILARNKQPKGKR